MPTDLLISSILCDPLQTFNIFKTNTVRFMKNLPHPPQIFDGWLSLLAQMVKNLPAMWGAWVQFLGVEYPLEKETATHSKILAWKIPWVEEPGELQSMGSQRVRPHWVTNTFILDILYKPLWHCFPHATGGRNNFIWRSFMMVGPEHCIRCIHLLSTNFSRVPKSCCISVFTGEFSYESSCGNVYSAAQSISVVWGPAALASPGSFWEMRSMWLHCRHNESNSATKIPRRVYAHVSVQKAFSGHGQQNSILCSPFLLSKILTSSTSLRTLQCT